MTIFQKWVNGDIKKVSAFESSLMKLYIKADPENSKILEEAYPLYFRDDSEQMQSPKHEHIKSIDVDYAAGGDYHDVITLKNGMVIRIGTGQIGISANAKKDEQGKYITVTDFIKR